MSMSKPDPYTAVMIVPTGIGASIGGYAGDAQPSKFSVLLYRELVWHGVNVVTKFSLNRAKLRMNYESILLA